MQQMTRPKNSTDNIAGERRRRALSTSERGSRMGSSQNELTLLTEFQQIVRYTRTKRQKSQRELKKSRSSLDKLVEKRKAEQKEEQQRESGPGLRRRVTVGSISLREKLEGTTFSRNIEFLQAKTEALSSNSARGIKSRPVPTRAMSNPFLFADAGDDVSLPSADVCPYNDDEEESVKSELTYEDDTDDNVSICSAPACMEKRRRPSAAEALKEKLEGSIFLKNVDFLQAKTEELSRTIHGGPNVHGEAIEKVVPEEATFSGYVGYLYDITEEYLADTTEAVTQSVQDTMDNLQDTAEELSRNVADSFASQAPVEQQANPQDESAAPQEEESYMEYVTQELTRNVSTTFTQATAAPEEVEEEPDTPQEKIDPFAIFSKNVDFLKESWFGAKRAT